MGLENGAVQNEMIRVSSSRDGNLNPPNARLSSPGAWVPSTNDPNQYIEVSEYSRSSIWFNKGSFKG